MLSCKNDVIIDLIRKKLLQKLKLYIQEILQIQVTTRLWKRRDELPFYLLNLYEFYEIKLLEKSYLLMISKEDIGILPTEVRRHMNQVEKTWSGPCIFIQQTISSHHRARLIKKHIPFIVPKNQMYLPDIGIDLREHYTKMKTKKAKLLSPATQAVVLLALFDSQNKKYFTVELSKRLGYTVMTINRAFDELRATKIGEVQWEGKERVWTLSNSKKELWEQTKKIMRNPVRKRIWLREFEPERKPKVIAGLSALSENSMLNPPALPIYALSLNEYKNLAKDEILSSYEDAAAELEIWDYDPHLFQQEGCVDPFSLYLSLIDSIDPRIESALETMMEKIKW